MLNDEQIEAEMERQIQACIDLAAGGNTDGTWRMVRAAYEECLDLFRDCEGGYECAADEMTSRADELHRVGRLRARLGDSSEEMSSWYKAAETFRRCARLILVRNESELDQQ